jgi:hypothetical protein
MRNVYGLCVTVSFVDQIFVGVVDARDHPSSLFIGSVQEMFDE